MNLKKCIQGLQYRINAQRRGIKFPQDATSPKWQPKTPIYKGEHILIAGIVDEKTKQWLKKRELWVEPEAAQMLLFDESCTYADDLIQIRNRAAKNTPCVFWKKDPKAVMLIPESQFTHLFVSAEESIGDNWQTLPAFVDFTQFNPVGHGSQNMMVGIGLLLTAGMEHYLHVPSVSDLLTRWAERDELGIWRVGQGELDCFKQDLRFCSSAMASVDHLSQADSKVIAQVILNCTGQTISLQEKLQRMAQGQVWMDVWEQDGIPMVTDPASGEEKSMAQFLLEGLETHNNLLKTRTGMLRRIYRSSSMEGQLNQIGKAVLGSFVYVPGVSILVVSNKPEYFDKILDNFRRQKLYHKELIVVFHCSNKPSAGEIRQMMAKALPEEQIQIFWRNSAAISFGYCINEGVSLTNMEFVAKFDDDDFYGDNFLTDIVPAFSYTDADVCGRISFHTYLEETESLIIRKPGNEYMYCKFLPGATIVARRSVFEKTLFRDIPRDIDGKFGVDCTEAGVKMFAVDTFQLLVMRASDKSKHTWKASDSVILKQSLPAHPDIDTDLETYSAYYKPFFPSITKEKAKKMISV